MSHKHKEKLPPFIALFRHTVKSTAWKALSVGARATFFALKANYNTKAQNAVYLAARTGAKELGVNKDTVRKWLRELEHYGFIIEVEGAHLGVRGVGKAALYRLTDSGYRGTAPTYDFQNWDGVLFERKKQNPVRFCRTPRPVLSDKQRRPKVPQNTEQRPVLSDKWANHECPVQSDITSLTSSRPNSEVPGGAEVVPFPPACLVRSSAY